MKTAIQSLFISIALVSFFLNANNCLAQEAFIEEVVSELLVQEVNKVRKQEGLHVLDVDETLDAIAFDQAEYILKIGKVTHEQEQEKKKTLLDRILYYEGLFAQAGENAVMVGVGSKEQIENNGPRVLINTEANAVKAAIVSWLDEEEGRLNLLDPNFYQLGTAVIIQENKEIIFVIVAASLPYLRPNSDKVATNFHGIKNHSDENCKSFLENNPTLPQLFSDAIEVEGNEVFFRYHNLDYVNEIIDNSSDGLAIDIIRDSQFNCHEGNRLFPSEINNGYLLSPAKKGKLNTLNTLKDEAEVKLSLGELPDFYDPSNCELNLLMIKKGSFCETIPYNKLQVDYQGWFDLPYLLAGRSDTNTYTWNDSSTIVIPLTDGMDLKQEIKKLLELLKELDYYYSSVNLDVYVSPIGFEGVGEDFISIITNEFEDIPFGGSYNVAWKEYFEFQKGTFHQLETDGKDTTEIIAYLKTQKDEGLSSFREKVNKVDLTVIGEATISNATSKEAKVDLLKRLIADQRIGPAQYLQAKLIQSVLEKKIDQAAIPIVNPSQKKVTLPLINNQIVLKYDLGDSIYDGNPIHLAFLELYLINKKQTEVSFNKHISELKYWSAKPSGMKNFESWEDGFKLLSANVPAELYSRAFLNYQLMAADYYFDKGDFAKRKKAFSEIMKWQLKANLNNEELLNLAKYLCYQDQYDKAILLLKPLASLAKPNEKILSYFLQIVIYDQELLNSTFYLECLKKLQTLYPKPFCNVFSKQKAGIQMLVKEEVKELYCSSCN